MQYGEVQEHQIMRDHSTSRSRGFGFITFEAEQAVDDLLAKGNKLELAGAQVSKVLFLICICYLLFLHMINMLLQSMTACNGGTFSI